MLPRGFRVSHYEIIERLGSGASGEVYRARDARLARDVAIKILRTDRPPGDRAHARFEKEARAASALNHPNIAHIYDIGDVEIPLEQGGSVSTSYIAMELVRGTTLRQRLRTGASREQLMDWIAQAADGLAKAHSAGIVHRDLKPENLMIGDDGYVKLVDFGLAKLKEPKADPTFDTESPTEPIAENTEGSIAGTPAYMSPEHLTGKGLDARSDVFALGVIMFESFAGQRPFGGDSMLEILHAIAYEKPANLPASLPADLRAVILRCIDKDPARRFDSAAELAAEVRRLRSGEKVQTRPPDTLTRRVAVAAVAIALVAAVLAVLYVLRTGRHDAAVSAPAARPTITSIAVLPLRNSSGDQEIEYLSDGMTDSIIFTLSRVDSLRVMSRSSVFGFKGKDVLPVDAGRKLGVDAVLAGEVEQHGDRIRVSAELVTVSDGAVVWGQAYERATGDALAIQDRISREVLTTLRAALSPEEKAKLGRQPTEDPDAYSEYLKGRFFWNKRTADGLQKAIEHFGAALDRDPAFALAWAGLGDAYALREQYAGIPSKDNCPKALEAAQKAIALDETLAAPHASMGLIDAHCSWNWSASEREFQRAIALDPKYATAHHWYALHLGYRLRHEEALREAKRAQELDPLSPIVGNVVSVALDYARRWDESIAQSDRVLELDPEFAVAHQLKGRALCSKGDFRAAIPELQRAVELGSGKSSESIGFLGVAFAKSGDRAKAIEQIHILSEGLGANPTLAYPIAKVHAALGERDEALRWLEKARESHSWHLVELQVEPAFDPIRDDPGFRELVKTVGFAR